jgi:alanine racemase
MNTLFNLSTDINYTSTLEVNLAAIRNNVRVMSEFVHSSVKKLAVIKSNGYGLGAIEIAQSLPEMDFFAVATIGEAIELRMAGIQQEIMVFSPVQVQSAPYFLKFNIIAVISSLDQLSNIASGTRVHIQFDTGMYRFGILPSDAYLAAKTVLNSPIQLEGILTHFANSGEPGDKSVSQQLSIFNEIRSLFPSNILSHAANTGAIAFYPEAHLDMIRIGVSLYGYAAGSIPIDGLQEVARWKSSIIHTKPVKKGVGIGYSWTFSAPCDGYIGIIPVGYADGLKRELGNQIVFKMKDEYVPVVGRVTMDYSTIFSPNPIEIGTEIELLGNGQHSAYKMADATRSIPYEILTSIGHKRVKRVYTY